MTDGSIIWSLAVKSFLRLVASQYFWEHSWQPMDSDWSLVAHSTGKGSQKHQPAVLFCQTFQYQPSIHKWALSGARVDSWLFAKSLKKYTAFTNFSKRPCPSTNKNVLNFQVLSPLIVKSLVVISWRSHSTHSSFEAFFTHLKSRNAFRFCERDWTDGWADGEYKIVLQETAREAACSHPSLLVC